MASACTSTLKLPTFFLTFQAEERVIRVNKSKITGGNSFNRDNFDIEGNHGSSKNEKNFVWGIFADLRPVL